MTAVLYWLGTRIARYLLLPLYMRVEVSGLENVPRGGALLVVCNHLNDADPVILAAMMPRRLVFMAKAEIFRIPLLAHVFRALGAFPVRRNAADLSALRRAKETLSRGLTLAVFPEGRTSTKAARLNEAWPGAALIAQRSEAPLLPVAIIGSQHLQWPAMFLRIFRRSKVTLTIGEPFELPRTVRVNAASADTATRIIMERIAALLPEEYRGYYGSVHPAAATASEPGERSGP